MNQLMIVLSFLFLSLTARSHIEVLFHPTDPTLPKIAEWVQQAKQSLDIAMYDLDTSDQSPFILALQDPAVQSRLATGELSLRFIYEGYGLPADKEKKMAQLESLGADVRFVTSSKKVHHKFAVIDANLTPSRVITGSANWSTFSFRNYDENILFIDQEPMVTANYENEFELLWNHSTEFGRAQSHPPIMVPPIAPGTDAVQIYFNSPRHILKNKDPEHNLTAQIIKLIDAAATEIQIASTRVRTTSILDSLLAASQRGVKIKILISQDDYHDLYARAKWLLNQPNIELRIKFYSLDPSQFMTYQMHNKFMLIDKTIILTGSFNWSDSGENNHIENLIVLKTDPAAPLEISFSERFILLWERGRQTLPAFEEALRNDKLNHQIPKCSFPAISLTYQEIKGLLKLAPKCF